MVLVLIMLVVCLIGKDLAYAPFPYALRAIAQSMCLMVGCVTIMPYLSGEFIRRYWPLLGYLAVLLATAPLAKFPLFVLLQVISLASVVIFFMAYFERQRQLGLSNVGPLVVSVIAAYMTACLISLALIKINPSLAYENQFIGNVSGYELRFKGLFSKSGVMGAASGLLVGLVFLRCRGLATKVFLVAPGLVCLILTQSRTFWIAVLVAGAVTMWRYYPRYVRLLTFTAMAAAMAILVLIALNLRLNVGAAEKFARLETLTTLTGRTSLWNEALASFSNNPWLGYGFTLGGIGVESRQQEAGSPLSMEAATQFSKQTMHSGYIQSLLDSGAIGFFFYLVAMGLAIKTLLKNDIDRKYPEAMYVLVFLTVANSAESVIYSGSVFPSLCFWAFVVFSLSLRDEVRQSPIYSRVVNDDQANPLLQNLMR